MQLGKIVLVVLVALGLTISASIFTFSIIKTSLTNDIAQSLQVVRDTAYHGLITWGRETVHHANAIVTDPKVIAYTEAILAEPRNRQALLASAVQQQLRNYLTPLLHAHRLRGFYIIAPSNISVASSRDSNVGTTNLLTHQPEILNKAWRGQIQLTPPQPSDVALVDNNGVLVENYPTMFSTALIRNQQHQVIALLAISLDPKADVQNILSRGQMGESGETYLINKHGYLLTESRFNSQLSELQQLKENSPSAFNIRAMVPAVSNGELPSYTVMATSALSGETTYNVDGYLDYRGIKVVGAWLWDPDLQFGLATEMDYAEAFAAYEQTKQSFILFTSATCLFYIGVAIGVYYLMARLQRQQVKFKSIYDNAGDPLLITDLDTGTYISVNNLASEFLGYSKTELMGMHVSMIRSHSSLDQVNQDIENVLNIGSLKFETSIRTKLGEVIPVETSAKLVPYGDKLAILSILRDISARKEAENTLTELLITDSLTGLANKNHFQNIMGEKLFEANAASEKLAILFLNIDAFRVVNDNLGHAIGDQTLIKVSQLLINTIPENALAFRFGGDEFTIIAPIKDQQCAIQIACQLQQAMSKPLSIADNIFHLSASIGIALSPLDGNDGAQLLQSADTALNYAKHLGHGRYACFSEDMRITDALHLAISTALAHAIDNKEFSLQFQPVVITDTGELSGAEALIRWDSHLLGEISPAVFIPIAEQTGKINEIGNWVLNEALRIRAEWQNLGLTSLTMSINLSPAQIISSDIFNIVANALERHHLPGNSIALEITEGVFLDNRKELLNLMNGLKQLGVSFYLDDFGTGYSSLSYVSSYPFDIIKIDKSFVEDMEHSARSRTLAKTVISMASSLDLQVIAEGVETPWQSQFLKDNNCHKIQGYLYGQPLDSKEFLQRWQVTANINEDVSSVDRTAALE
ncbi:EAL domain-containing protein [Agarivorans sp. TSD2052]|uniref:bifunctional diguanylate cyclase/phosphodiesterase n=1 Tax=Agarivorans sp. TSD2052 TaxID=2937286 RepID=UPI00200FE68D|nr:EAL domain-containing protein [Agarivorans sp. TSD2052]UPW20236.1 EAL domain-containing protein [Agarivorans sp. TSD2052]